MPSKNIHLIIDAQLLQTSDKSRGMGLFTRSLLNNIEDDVPVIFIVNKNLQKLSQEDLEIAHKLKAKIEYLDLMHHGSNEEFKDSEAHNIRKIDEFISSIGKNADVKYFIPALFSSEIHPVFPSELTTNIILFHDLIPFLYHQNYFPSHNSVAYKDYVQRFRQFYEAHFIVTNSVTTADDLTVYFGVDPSRIIPILGSAADRSHMQPNKPKIKGLKDKFILMPSGDDFRKNNAAAVRAFSNLNTGLQLVITSKFSPGTKKELRSISSNIIFTDSVSDPEFLWLLDNAQVVFFPPEYEGLGMPLLEAVQRKAIIACSNIPVFIEISKDSFFYFDPKSTQSMTDALAYSLAVDKNEYLKKIDKDYKRILQDFNWKTVAQRFTQVLRLKKTFIEKKKLAVLCPSPSSYSAVGKYVFETHSELSQFFSIDYYAENGLTVSEPTRLNILEGAADYYPASSFTPKKAAEYDHILYNIGNSEFHIDTILNSLRIPANAIIHDTKLNGIFDWLERQKFLSRERRQLETKLDHIFQTKDTANLMSISTNQNSLFVHSLFAKKALEKIKRTKIHKTILAVGVPKIEIDKWTSKTVSFAGIISEDKGISIVSEIAEDRSININIFGFGVLGDSPLLNGLGENVTITKDLSDKQFQDQLRATNILVNYRPNYHGETSKSTLEAMRHGVVVIVKRVGWYDELPDNVVVKVDSAADIKPAVDGLLSNPAKMEKIAENARKFLSKEYSYKTYAENIKRFLEV